MTLTLPDRFWVKVDITPGCWLWTGAPNSGGYGELNIGGRAGRMHRAHVLSFLAHGGVLGVGEIVDHKCHVRLCVNPSHLQAATRRQNSENRAGLDASNSSGARGVSWHKRSRKWEVSVTAAGRKHYGGLFVTVADADAAATALRNELMTNNLADR